MADPTPPPDDHIEDLLSQLQGIFGRLSGTEDEETGEKKRPAPPPIPFPKRTVEPPPPVQAPSVETPEALPELPAMADAPPAEVSLPILQIPKAPIQAPVIEVLPPEPAPLVVEQAPVELPPIEMAPSPELPPVTPEPEPAPEPAPVLTETAPDPFIIPMPQPPAAPPPVEMPAPPVVAPSEPAAVYQSQVTPADDGSAVPTAVFFPIGRDAEARALAQKLETMTPKFTKVAFRLRVVLCKSYDPRADWRQQIVQNASQETLRSVFIVVDRSLEDSRKRELVASFEPQGIYFQEVPMASIEKKAFYTDLLLGLVFFFDSLKPRPAGDNS